MTELDAIQAIQRFKDGRASLGELRNLPADLGKLRLEAGLPIVIALLDHLDAIVRYNAIIAIGMDFKQLFCAGKLRRILAEDSDDNCRGASAAGLGVLGLGTKDGETLKALAYAAINDSEEEVRLSAYDALLEVNGLTEQEYLRGLQKEDREVNISTVREILNHAGIEGP